MKKYSAAIFIILTGVFNIAAAQHQSGEAAYLQLCAPCHINTVSGEGGGDDRAPTLEAIGFMSPIRVRNALASDPKSNYVKELSTKTFEEFMILLVPNEDS